jgi:hypothetical protein
MSNLVKRTGSVQVRVGGNSQETASLVQNTTDGHILEKNLQGISNPVCRHLGLRPIHLIEPGLRPKHHLWYSRQTFFT